MSAAGTNATTFLTRHIQAALEAGFDEHLTKPPDRERLERLIKDNGAGGDAVVRLSDSLIVE